MPCQDHYEDRVREVTRTIEVDKPATIKKLVDMENMLCNVGFILRNNPNIKAKKKEINEILAWHEKHRIEELIVILERNKVIYNEMIGKVETIRRLGGEPKPKVVSEMKLAWGKIEDLEKKIRAKDVSLLYNRDNDCSLELK